MSETMKFNVEVNPTPNEKMMPLDFDNIASELPLTHLWPSSSIEDHPSKFISVPVIDLANPGQEELDKIRSACEDWGFFQIINHGVPKKILEEFKTEIAALFALPSNVKRLTLKGQEHAGYGTLPVVRFAPNALWHEGFGIGSQSKLYEHAAKLWPPHGNPKFCHVIEDYKAKMKTLAEKVLTLMFASIGIAPEDVMLAEPKTKEDPFGPHQTHFQLNSYPPCPDPAHAMGLHQHADTSIITLLNQVNNVSGLQVLHQDTWVTVEPIHNAFVVNCGDLGHFISNGRFTSAFHRVVPNDKKHRFSAALFYQPPDHAPVAPIPKLVKPGEKPVFRPITWKDYLDAKYELGSKVLDYVRTDGVVKN